MGNYFADLRAQEAQQNGNGDASPPTTSAPPTAPLTDAAPSGAGNGNYFANLNAQEQTAKQAQMNPDDGAFFAGLENFNRSFGRMAEGVLKRGANLLGATDYANTVNNTSLALDASAAKAAEQHPMAAGVGNFVGETAKYVPAMVATSGIGAAAKGVQALSKAVGLGGASGLIMESLNNTQTDSQQMDNAFYGTLTGMGGGAAGFLLGKAMSTIGNYLSPNKTPGTGFLTKVLDPDKAALNSVANEVSSNSINSAEMAAKQKAAENIGSYLSPAESIGTKSAIKKEASTVLQSEGDKTLLNNLVTNRDELLRKKLTDTIDKANPDINEAIATLKPLDGESSVTLKQIHKKFFGSDAQKTDFLDLVANKGGDPQLAGDLLDTIKNIKAGTLDKILERQVGQSPSSVGGKLAGVYQNILNNAIYGRYNQSLTQLMLDPQWSTQVAKVLEDRAQPNLFLKGLKNLIQTVNGTKVNPVTNKVTSNLNIGRTLGIGAAEDMRQSYIPATQPDSQTE